METVACPNKISWIACVWHLTSQDSPLSVRKSLLEHHELRVPGSLKVNAGLWLVNDLSTGVSLVWLSPGVSGCSPLPGCGVHGGPGPVRPPDHPPLHPPHHGLAPPLPRVRGQGQSMSACLMIWDEAFFWMWQIGIVFQRTSRVIIYARLSRSMSELSYSGLADFWQVMLASDWSILWII